MPRCRKALVAILCQQALACPRQLLGPLRRSHHRGFGAARSPTRGPNEAEDVGAVLCDQRRSEDLSTPRRRLRMVSFRVCGRKPNH
jgi:hypothetical protein